MSLEQRDLFLPDIVRFALEHHAQFRDDFLAWLPQNLHVWNAFKGESFKVIQRGYTHYSGRTIIEFLRHHTALEESPTPGHDWKLNNNYPPYLVRLFDLAYPEHAGLFEYRVTKKVVTPACQLHGSFDLGTNG
jgi:hypothetical protein